MASSPAALLDRLTRGRGEKALRYSAVSVVGIITTQTLLVLLAGIMNIQPVTANVLAVTISAVPVFLLNKRWVWGRQGRARMRREVLPFWGLTLVGLLLSSGLVAVAHEHSDRTIWVMIANISGFGLVWVAKFLFLDAIVFAPQDDDVPEGAL
ncbi:MAG: GtrA family protein [Acidimicrobiales bacterium]|nr:GtrA family protein [Acidimicrobiales bacterium]